MFHWNLHSHTEDESNTTSSPCDNCLRWSPQLYRDSQCSWAWSKYMLKSIFPCPWTCLLAFDEYDCHPLLKGKMQDMLPKQNIFKGMDSYNQEVTITKAACCSFNSTDCTHGLGLCQLKQYVLLYRCLGFLRWGGFLWRLFMFIVWAHSQWAQMNTMNELGHIHPSIWLAIRFRVTCCAGFPSHHCLQHF